MLKSKINIKPIFLMLLAAFIITSGAKCGAPPAGLTLGSPKPITLNYWKVWEDSANIDELIALYRKDHPHIQINYRKLTYEEFEIELLKALAVDRGPDIFSVNTTWTKDYQDKIAPMPEYVNIPYAVKRGTIKEEIYTEVRKTKTPTLKDILTLYPEVVTENQVIDNKVYGLPLSIDTMVMFYNRDLLNNAGIVDPPKTWTDFQNQVIKLTKLSTQGTIVQAGAAFGTADNVQRSSDLLQLLMLQNGTKMIDDNGKISLDKIPAGMSVRPAVQALNFYTSFASPAKQVYTWNSTQQDSLQEFMAGKVAFFFGYAYHLGTIKAQAAGLNLGIAPMPQLQAESETSSFQPVNFANYWAETVSTKSKYQNEAWDFIIFMTTNKTANKTYLDTDPRKPPALKELISAYKDDIELAPFSDQILTSHNWYQGKSAGKAEEIFRTMIRKNLLGQETSEAIVAFGAKQLQFIY